MSQPACSASSLSENRPAATSPVLAPTAISPSSLGWRNALAFTVASVLGAVLTLLLSPLLLLLAAGEGLKSAFRRP